MMKKILVAGLILALCVLIIPVSASCNAIADYVDTDGDGDEEVASGKLTVTIRRKSQPKKSWKEQMTTDALIDAVHKDTESMPFRPLYTPRKLSKKARYI